jgi:two-component system response regulator
MEKTTILLVEDDPNDELLTLRALRMNKIKNEVVVVRDGSEALDFLFCKNKYADRDPDELPKLVLLDIKLPKVDGLEVLHRLRANPRTRLLPIVMLSSSKEEHDLTEAYRNGANSFMRKPVDYTQFMEYIRLLGLYWLQVNEHPPKSRNATMNDQQTSGQ